MKDINNVSTLILGLPHLAKTQQGNPRQAQRLTRANLEYTLDAMGISVQYNLMSQQVEFISDGLGDDQPSQVQARQAVIDLLACMDIPTGRVDDILMAVGIGDPFHPMEDWIRDAEWDGRDRLPDLCSTVPTDDVLWPVYLRKWLIQATAAVTECDRKKSLPHVLTFVGGQGAGKGRWLRRMGGEYALADAELHLNSYAGKDQQITALKYPLVELGEIDATFRKSDVSALKDFLSRTEDNIRMPYARVAIQRPRMTVFAASVNNVEFLNDPTGARRFWPVGLRDGERLDWAHDVDMQQVFAQMLVARESGEDWNLDDDQADLHRTHTEYFTSHPPIVELAQAHWAKYEEDYENYTILNKTEIARVIGAASSHRGDVAALGEWLTKHLGQARRLHGKYRSWAWPIGRENVQHVAATYKKLSKEEALRYTKWSD